MNQPPIEQLLRGYDLCVRTPEGTTERFTGDDFAEVFALPDGTLSVVDLAGNRRGLVGHIIMGKGTLKVWATVGGETRRFDHIDRFYSFPDGRTLGVYDATKNNKTAPIRGRVMRVKRQFL